MIAKENLIKQITDSLSWIEVSTRNRGLQGLFDQHVISEHFFAELLNTAFGWSLKLLPKNQAAVDLRDCVNHLVIQVTATSDRKKIEYAIAQFAKERENFVPYKLVILIVGKKKKYRKPFAKQKEIGFNPNKDLWDVPDILIKFRSLDTAAVQRIAEFLKREVVVPRIAVEPREEHLPDYAREIYAYLDVLYNDVGLFVTQYYDSENSHNNQKSNSLHGKMEEFVPLMSRYKLLVSDKLIEEITAFFDILCNYKREIEGAVSYNRNKTTYERWLKINSEFNTNTVLRFKKIKNSLKRFNTEDAVLDLPTGQTFKIIHKSNSFRPHAFLGDGRVDSIVNFTVDFDFINQKDEIIILNQPKITNLNTNSDLINNKKEVVRFNHYPETLTRYVFPYRFERRDRLSMRCEIDVELFNNEVMYFAGKLNSLKSYEIEFQFSYEDMTATTYSKQIKIDGTYDEFKSEVIRFWKEGNKTELIKLL